MQIDELNGKLAGFPFFVTISMRKPDGSAGEPSRERLKEVNPLSAYKLEGDEGCLVIIIDKPDDTGFVAFEQVNPEDSTTWIRLRRDPFLEKYCHSWSGPLYSIQGLETMHIDR